MPVCLFHSHGDSSKCETQLDALLAPVEGPGSGHEQEGRGLVGRQISTS